MLSCRKERDSLKDSYSKKAGDLQAALQNLQASKDELHASKVILEKLTSEADKVIFIFLVLLVFTNVPLLT